MRPGYYGLFNPDNGSIKMLSKFVTLLNFIRYVFFFHHIKYLINIQLQTSLSLLEILKPIVPQPCGSSC